VNFYKRFMADYARKTSRLTLAQHGAYTLLLDEVYATEKPLPADVNDLYRICRAMTKDEQNAVRTVAELYFPVNEDGVRTNPRACLELKLAEPAIEAARLNGGKGGRPRSKPEPEPNKNPVGFEVENPVGLQEETELVPNRKAPHSLEEYKEAKASSSTSLPDCPHEEIIDLYAKALPMLAQPRKSLWRDGKNAPALKARWRWVLTAKHESGRRAGQRIATTRDEALVWFERFFEYVAKSDFLTGKTDWACNLGWLVNQSNFEKVLSGQYENKEVAA